MSDDSMGAELWDEHPGERLRDVIMLPSTRDDVEVAMFYVEAANRRADSFRGQPFDDTMLIPWLNLRRHALELSLKGPIRAACHLRRKAGHADIAYPLALDKPINGCATRRVTA